MMASPGTSEHGPPPPVIALVGRPNVGKSTLFNRLTRSRQALVATLPGTTRDRREGAAQFGPWRFTLVDTGGMGFGLGLAFSAAVEAQIATAVERADYLWVVLDAKEGLNPFDAELHRWVMRSGKPYRLLVNKADNPARRGDLAEFYRLGSERIHPVSALHGSGLEELLEASAGDLPGLKAGQEALPSHEGEPEAGPLRVAFLGRPNVGKSSLVNRILGEARMIVSPVPGTTREAVETPFRIYDRDYVLVDTAGIRRKARTTEHLEKIGVLHSLGALVRVQVAVLVVDALETPAVQDARIAGYILDHRRAVVVALNKWDRIAKARAKDVEAEFRERLRFLEFAPFVRTSALEGEGLPQLFKEIAAAAEQFGRRIQTADLNRMVQAATLRATPPAQGRSATRIHYGLQVSTRPPAFRFFTNHPRQIDTSYTRYFERQLRFHFGLKGTPLQIDWQSTRSREGDPPARQAKGGPPPAGRPRRPGKPSPAGKRTSPSRRAAVAGRPPRKSSR
jgi:GTP-binding protein